MSADIVSLLINAVVIGAAVGVIFALAAPLLAVLIALAARLKGRPFNGVLSQGFLVPLELFRTVDEVLKTAIEWLRSQIEKAGAAMGGDGHWLGWKILGAWLYLAVFVISAIGDIGLLLLTFDAMKLGSGETFAVGAGADVLSAMGYLASGALFGLLLLDLLGLTHFGPWPTRGPKRNLLLVVAAVGLLAVVAAGAIMGTWRGIQLTDLEVGGRVDVLGVLVVNASLPVLLAMVAALSGWAFVFAAVSVWMVLLALPIPVLGVAGLPLRLAACLYEQSFQFIREALLVLPALRGREEPPVEGGAGPARGLPGVDIPPALPCGDGAHPGAATDATPDEELSLPMVGSAGPPRFGDDGWEDINRNPFGIRG